MREIKFRGKTVHRFDYGRWVYGGVSRNAISWVIHEYRKDMLVNGEYVDPETIGQYIGLKDKNGTEIYEGDIVKFSWDSSSTLVEFSGIVRFCEKEAAFQFWYDDLKDWSSLAGFESTEMEVIGNIFDNPDLKKHFQELGWKIKEE